jgi:hypothetical protein
MNKKNFYLSILFLVLLIFFYKHLLSNFELKNSESYVKTNFKSNKLTNLIIPFHIKQLSIVKENIIKWGKYLPCLTTSNQTQLPKITFFVSFSNEKSFPTHLKNTLLDLKDYFTCFSNKDNIDIVLYKMENKNDKHLLGARLMFEYLLAKRDVLFRNVKYIFYMEPDTRPIRSNWLMAIEKEIGETNFWIKGSYYLGSPEFIDINKIFLRFHINGNAIYNIGDEEFSNFYFNNLRPYIQRHNDSFYAYDVDFFEYIFDKDNYRKVQNIIHNFVTTEVILNLWHNKYNVTEVRKQYKNSYLVHGGFAKD